MHPRNKKICAILLCLCMLAGFLPVGVQAALVDGSDYITQQLYLGDDLTLHLRGKVDYPYADSAVATVAYGGQVDTYRLEDLTPCDNGEYEVTVDLAAAQMAEDITLTIKVGTLVIVEETYSVREYMRTLLEGSYTRETKALCYEALNYGAWAQKYFDHNADEPADSGYETEAGYPIPDELPAVSLTGSVSGIRYYGASVLFRSKTAVRYYFKADDGTDGYTFTVDGKQYTSVSKDGLHYIEVTGINPQSMDTKMTVLVTDGSSTLSVGYAPTDYFIRSYHRSSDATVRGMMEAAYSYFLAAKAFVGVASPADLNLTYSSGSSTTLRVDTDLPSETPLADFTLDENGCDVDQSGNLYQQASRVSMASTDGTISLTFHFENGFEAGQTYTLPKNALFCFTDNSQYALTQDYEFLFNGTSWSAVEQVEDEGLILGFESYQEITGAKLSVGNMLGKMAINTNTRYVSQGKASLKVEPQGDYSEPSKHPYFKLDLLDTTCTTSDFSALKNVSFDVYNDTDKQLHITVGIVAGESIDSYITTIKQTFALAPNGWTTCTYDLSVMAGYSIYDLGNVRYLTVEFMEHKDSRDAVPNVLYIDNLVGNAYADGEGPAAAEYDFGEGIDFETHGNEYLFTGQGNQERDADVERLTYTELGIDAPTDGGEYALKLSHGSNYWPTFRIHFGETLPAGTELSFMAYGKITGGTNLHNKSVFEFSSGGDATEEFACGQWTQLYLTLPEDADYIDLFWNYDRAVITSTYASGEVYIDNIMLATFEPAGDILEGYGFEERGNAERFTGQGDTENDATIKRFTYTELGIDAPTDGGEYALKLTHSSSQTPTFRINFGKELAAGTTVSFMAYAKLNSGYLYPKKNILNFSDGSAATASFNFKTWTTLTVTLPEAAEYLDLTWSFKATFGTAVCELYIDNIKAVEPAATPVGDFLEGIGFEVKGNEERFTGQGKDQDATIERVSYADLGIDAPTDGGDYALKLSHESNYWPTFRINFGKELAAGTQITFMAYGKINGESLYDQSIFEYSAGGEATAQFKCGQWTKLTITLSEAAQYVDLFWNYDRASITSTTASGEVYLDNFLAKEPAVLDITNSVTFEAEDDALYFAGQGKSQDATIERVGYTDLDIDAFTDGGSYALKLSHESSYWPTFRINFGKELAAGTQITFMAYGRITSGTNLHNKSLFEFSSGGDATNEFACGQWTQLSITLPADAEYIDLFWNFDRAVITSSTASGEVYIDNITVTEPE